MVEVKVSFLDCFMRLDMARLCFNFGPPVRACSKVFLLVALV